MHLAERSFQACRIYAAALPAPGSSGFHAAVVVKSERTVRGQRMEVFTSPATFNGLGQLMTPLRRLPARAIACAALALAASGAAQATATTIAVTNFNFEVNARPNGGLGASDLDGWQISGNRVSFGTYNPDTSYYNTPLITDPANGSGVIGTMSGPNMAFIFGATGEGATITTTTGHSAVAGETYLLTVAIGQRLNDQTFSPVTRPRYLSQRV